ncbi:MAG: glutaredoxin domain-containing protein [Nanoarchaeota archaeon]|nr:glutaredoxin domain-containing protein [Nanoarchaeota archaeon]
MKVIIYTTQTCPWCTKTKDFLKKNKIKYTAIDVSSNQKAAQEMMKKSGQMGVPVLDINGKIIVGFDPEGIIKAVGKKK